MVPTKQSFDHWPTRLIISTVEQSFHIHVHVQLICTSHIPPPPPRSTDQLMLTKVFYLKRRPQGVCSINPDSYTDSCPLPGQVEYREETAGLRKNNSFVYSVTRPSEPPGIYYTCTCTCIYTVSCTCTVHLLRYLYTCIHVHEQVYSFYNKKMHFCVIIL